MTALFCFFVALAISVEQKDPSAVESKVYPLLGSVLDQLQYSLAATSTWARNFEFYRERALCVLGFDSGVTGDFKNKPT